MLLKVFNTQRSSGEMKEISGKELFRSAADRIFCIEKERIISVIPEDSSYIILELIRTVPKAEKQRKIDSTREWYKLNLSHFHFALIR